MNKMLSRISESGVARYVVIILLAVISSATLLGVAAEGLSFKPIISFAGNAEDGREDGVDAVASSEIISREPDSTQSTVSVTAFGTALTQDFNTLASSGTSNADTTLPSGWYFVETGGQANTTYAADTGAGNSGNTYSYGATSATDRALGGLRSSNVNPTIGASFTNNTGKRIGSLAISFTGEQWRLGATGREDRIEFEYSTDATSLSTGTWTAVTELNFVAPVTSGTVGALVGNNSPNRTAKSHTIGSLNIPNGNAIWIRWKDFDPSGADDGLAVDDFSITASLKVAETTVSSGPALVTTSNSATFVFSSDDSDSTFECKLGTSSFESCTSSKTYSGLSDGSYTFEVRATNAAGTDATPASYTWVVDTTSPGSPTITSSPASVTNSTAATFEFSGGADNSGGSGFAKYQCKLDSGSFADCTSPQNLTGLTEGSHTVSVRSVDNAGNIGTATDYTWAVDLTSPGVPTIGAKPDAVTNSSSASFTFSGGADNAGGSGFAKYQCKLDSGAYADCTSPKGFTELGDGAHTFLVRSVDSAGNAGDASEYTWTVDTTAPGSPSIDSKPDSSTNQTSASFTFSGGSDNAGGSGFGKYECKLNGGSFAECTSPKEYSGLAETTHTFSVRSVDIAGNAGSATEYSWAVDVTAPGSPTIDTKPDAVTNSTSASFAFSGGTDNGGGSGLAGYQCKLDSGSYADCSSPKSYSGLSEGSHAFSVRSVDNAGNTGTATEYAWTVDLSNPEVTLNGPSGLTNDATPTFTFSASEKNASFECSLNEEAFEECTSPVTLATLVDGMYSFRVRARDIGGNLSTPASRSFTVDTEAPHIGVVPTPDAIPNQTATKIVFSVGDANGVESVKLLYTTLVAPTSNALEGVAVFSEVSCALAQMASPSAHQVDPLYECEIPAIVGPNYVSFYVEASDAAGNSSENPSPATPNLVAVRGAMGEAAPLPSGTYTNVAIIGDQQLTGDVEILGVLSLSGPNVVSGGKLILGCDSSVDQPDTNSYVVGTIEKQFCERNELFRFPIGVSEPGVNATDGTSGGASSIYAPATIRILEVPSPGSSVTIVAFAGTLPGVAPTNNVGVYWTTTEVGDITADLRFQWSVASEVGNPMLYSPLRRSNGVTEVISSPFGSIDLIDTTVEFFGVTDFNGPASPGIDEPNGMSAPSVPYGWTAGLIGTTAGSSDLSGRVLSNTGGGLKDVIVTLTGGNLSQPIQVRTNQFGTYKFTGLEAGETYVVSVISQRYSFGLPVKVLYLGESLSGEDFIADPK